MLKKMYYYLIISKLGNSTMITNNYLGTKRCFSCLYYLWSIFEIKWNEIGY